MCSIYLFIYFTLLYFYLKAYFNQYFTFQTSCFFLYNSIHMFTVEKFFLHRTDIFENGGDLEASQNQH